MRAPGLIAAALLAISVVGCGPAAAPTLAPTGAPGGPIVTITRSFSFSPQQVTVPFGGTVTWTNTDSTDHTITSGTPGSPSGKFSHVVEAGQKVTITFTETGTFEYFCSFHNQMRGSVTVN